LPRENLSQEIQQVVYHLEVSAMAIVIATNAPVIEAVRVPPSA
jgi:hypothetical protein